MRYLSLILAFLMATFPLQVIADSARVTLVSPPSGEELTGKDIEIAVSYNSQSTDKITYVELLVDGKRYAGKYLEYPQTRGVCSFLWDSTSYTNGAHALIVKIFAGDKLLGSVSGTANLGNKPVDVIPPTIQFYGVKSGETVSGAREIKLQAKDNSGKSPIVSVSVDSNLKLIKNTPPYNFAWDTTAYDNGQHVVEAWGYDEAGNRGDAGRLTLTVKNTRTSAVASAKVSEKPEPVKIDETVKSTTEPVIPAISAPAKSEVARSITTVPVLPEVSPGLTAPAIKLTEPPSTSVVVAKAVEALVGTPDYTVNKAPADVKVTSLGMTIASSGPVAAKDSGLEAEPSVEMALATPSVEIASTVTNDGTRVSMPSMVRPAPVTNSQVLSTGVSGISDSIAGSIEPSTSSLSNAVAMAPALNDTMHVDPLDIPTRSTSPGLRIPAPEMMAMRSSSMTIECPVLEVSPTNPELPVMTPQTAPVRSASADLKGLELGIEAGMRTVVPSTGLAGVKIAQLPVKAQKAAPKASVKPAKKTMKSIHGSVKLVLDDGTLNLQSADSKKGIPAAALRSIAEQLGGLVVWDKDTKTITTYKKGLRITMKVGEPVARVNGKSVKMACPVIVSKDQTLADLKFLKKIFEMDLEYDPATGEFTLTTK